MSKGYRYSDEFKQEAVNQVTVHGYAVVDVATRLSISDKTLYNWIKIFSKPVKKRLEDNDLQAEIARLKRELKRVEQERNILKEAAVNSHGYEDLFHWATQFGQLEVAGIEGTGTYGAALYRYLQSKGITVIEVNRPDRSKRRMHGKSDPLDAENAARAVLAGTATAIPKDKNGACEAIRMVLVARRSAVKAKTQAMNQIRALLVSGPQEIRERLWRTKPHECAKACLSVCSGQIIPDTLLRISSAASGVKPRLNVCGRC